MGRYIGGKAPPANVVITTIKHHSTVQNVIDSDSKKGRWTPGFVFTKRTTCKNNKKTDAEGTEEDRGGDGRLSEQERIACV